MSLLAVGRAVCNSSLGSHAPGVCSASYRESKLEGSHSKRQAVNDPGPWAILESLVPGGGILSCG